MVTVQISAAAEKLGLPIWANLCILWRKEKVEVVTDVSEVNQEGLRTRLKWWGEEQFDSLVKSTAEANEEWDKGLALIFSHWEWNLGVAFFFKLFAFCYR